MSYSVYFKYGGRTYKLPVNPEHIKRTRSLKVETYQVLKSGQVSVPEYVELEEFTFEAEFPSTEIHYQETGSRADADYYEKMFRRAQTNKKPIRFIASNDITDDISTLALVKSLEVTEKAGEEGDKYISLTLQEYKAPGKRYIAINTDSGMAMQEDKGAEADGQVHPSVTETKTHTVQKGDTLWGIAKRYYGNGEQYGKIATENGIVSPNVIAAGQILRIPV